MFVTGFIVGLALVGLVFAVRVTFVVREGEAAMLTAFGRPVARTYGPGLHAKAPWHKVHRAVLAELSAPISYHETRGVLAHDGTPLRVDAVARYHVVPEDLARYLFAVDHAEEHFNELFECIVRSTITNFAPAEKDPTAYARLRRDRREFSDELSRACTATLADTYGIAFNAVDVSSLSPPKELEEALNAVLHAEAMAGVQLEQASAICQQRVVAADEGVRIAEQKSQAIYDEMATLAEYLRELKQAGTLDDYIHHRRSEILNQAKSVFVRSAR